jgi:hypothetical protein
MNERPPRVTVTHPRTASAHRARRTSVRREVGEQTALGEVVLRSLERAQLRLALLVAAVVGAVMFGIPVLFLAWPAARQAQVGGLPLGWLLLGLVVFPVIVVAGWLYVRGAERNERRFSRLVERR